MEVKTSPPRDARAPGDPVGYLLDQLGLNCHITHAHSLSTGMRWKSVEPRTEFYFVISGPAVKLETGTEAIDLQPGDAAFLWKKPRHSAGGDVLLTGLPGNACSRVLSGVISANGILADLAEILPDGLLLGRQEDLDPMMRMLLMTAAKEAESLADGAWVVINQLLTAICLQALRRHVTQLDPSVIAWLNAFRNSDICRALTSMLQAPQRRWTVELLAETCQLPRSTFARRFQELTGQTPMTVLLEIRMKTACELLTTARPLKEVARHTGYRSLPAFTYAFRKWSGMTPKTYRDHDQRLGFRGDGAPSARSV